MVHIRRVNFEEHGDKVDTVGQDQYKNCVQYYFQFTSEYSELDILYNVHGLGRGFFNFINKKSPLFKKFKKFRNMNSEFKNLLSIKEL